ncbi:T9SS type A sorting domain-containing protein [bacterium]|nr:T9SS type A sorting domain-containing protein [bacterium]
MKTTARVWGNWLFSVHVALFVLATNNNLHAQKIGMRSTADGQVISLIAADGRTIQLSAAADDDEDGIENLLEVNGFTYSPGAGLQPWDGDTTKTYYKTDPLRWSTDGDPYSDFMEVSGVNMPAGVPAPENHPLVAARPVIKIGMDNYDVIPISEITTSEGGEQSSSFTNETSSSDEVGGEVTVGASLNPLKLVSAEVTASYSHTWTRTQSSTSSFGTNWSNTRSTNPSQAARLKLNVYMQNLGSATALEVKPTFNLVLGEKTIATLTPNQVANRLAPAGLPRSRYPEFGSIAIEKDDQNNDIILTLEELKAVQMGAPLGLVVTQMQADVARWNPATQSFDSREAWSSFEGEIDPVVVTVKANLGGDDIRYYQVYVGTDFYNLGFNFRDVLSQVFEVEESNGVTTIAGRRYPDDWYVSTPSQPVLQEWNRQGQPPNLLGLKMFRNTQMALMSPGVDPQAAVDLATFDPEFKRIYVSAFPGNFPILSVRAQVTIDGVERDIELFADENSFYTNNVPFENPADPEGKVLVENARGDVTETSIILPALYTNAAEVKKFTALLPNPGAEYLLFSGGDANKPVKLYCLFFDPKTGTPLATPREYLTLPASNESSNYIDWIQDPFYRRAYFSKVRINPDNFKISAGDTTFTRREWRSSQQGTFFGEDPLFFGSIRLTFAHLDSAFANVNLTGTPFSLDPYAEFQIAERGAHEVIYVDASRQIMNVKVTEPPNHNSDSQGRIGLKGDSISVVYKREFYRGAAGVKLPGRTAGFNLRSTGDQGYVNMGSSPTLEVSDAFTLEAWIKPEPHGRSANLQGVFINKEGEYELARFSDGTIRWAVAVNSPRWIWINTGYFAPENEWVHVALVYDRNAPKPAIKTYINGTLFHATLAAGPVSDFPQHETQDEFRIAARQGTGDSQYAGQVDEVRVWSVARTQAQIRAALGDTLGAEIYANAGSGLRGYWRFDELADLDIGGDGANDVRDFSVNGNHGDLVGDAQLSDFTTEVKDEKPELPADFSLSQNYPNPFNPSTTIGFRLSAPAEVRLAIYSVNGQLVRTLVNGRLASGQHEAVWDGRNERGSTVASGIYFYRIRAGAWTQTRRMLLVR